MVYIIAGCKDIQIRKLELVAKTSFFLENDLHNSQLVLKQINCINTDLKSEVTSRNGFFR